MALPTFPFDTASPLDDQPEAARIRAEAPLGRVQLGDGRPVWLAVGYEAVRTVLSDHRFSRAAGSVAGAPTITPGLADQPDLMVNMDPPAHTRLRRLMAGAFTARMVEQRRPRVREIVGRLLDAVAEQGPPADLVAGLAFPLPITVLCDLLGMPYEDIEHLRRWTETVGSGDQQAAVEAVGAMASYVAGIIARKREHPGDDLISRLIEARDQDDRLSEGELLNTTFGIMGAGFETTANQIALLLLALFRNPDQLDRLRARPELVPGAVEELLRFTRLTAATFTRVATTDVEIGGVTVPAGQTVFPLQASANRDESVYPDPNRLDVTREGPSHLAFGTGAHVCIGASLARVELQEALAGLLARFPALALAAPESDLEWRPAGFTNGVRSLPVTW
jgi:cytochrome P450